MYLGSERFKVQFSRFGPGLNSFLAEQVQSSEIFGGVRKGLKFGFSSREFEAVHFIWVHTITK